MVDINKFNEFVKEHTVPGTDSFFKMNALTGELGEFANVLKKEVWYTKFPDYKQKVDQEEASGERPTIRSQKVDEAGDVLFYLLQVFNSEGITLEEIVSMQTRKIEQQSEEAQRVYQK